MQIKIQKNLMRLIGWLAASLIIGGCNYQEKTSVRDSVLVYCSEGSPETFNPQLSTSGVTFDASSKTLYNRLIEFKPGSSYLQPALATDWTVSEDGKEYTFQLRKNVAFHTTQYFTPSRNFNADDVIFSFRKQSQKDHPFHDTSALDYRYFDSMDLGDLIDSIQKTDSHTVVFRLNRAESPFLATLAMDFASILSAEYAQKLLKDGNVEAIDTQPVGTGPFQLERFRPDAFIRYKAHPLYWQGKQPINNLVFAITPDPSLRFARIVAGECDVMANPLPVHLLAASQFDNTEVISEAGLNVSFLSLNTQKAPFDNEQVRIALNYAINKQQIIKAVFQQTATPAITPIPPNMWAFDDSIEDYPFDPIKAKNLLRQAGFPNGFDMSIWTMSAQRAYNPNAKKMAELIQQDLRDVGIKVEITTFEYGAFLNKVRQGEHHSALMGWIGDNGDPDNFFTPLLSCSATVTGTNSSFWCDPQFNSLIHQARSQNSLHYRKNLYAQALRIFKQAAPWVPIAHATQHVILNPRVKNFKTVPTGGVYFRDVFLQNQQGLKDE